MSGSVDAAARVARAERVRLVALGVMLAAMLVSSLGLQWDLQWHHWIGRDRFLTPPHVLIYAGVLISSLAPLLVIARESWPGRTTCDGAIELFGVLRAPRGFFVAGCGALTCALAAPLDNYWHELYGIDVTLWAPFHLMGLIGGIGMVVGAAYVAAGLRSRAAARGVSGRMLAGFGAFVLLALLPLSNLLRSLDVLVSPIWGLYPTLQAGPLAIAAGPAALTAVVTLVCAAACALGERGEAAVVVILFASVVTAVGEVFTPWAVRTLAVAQGYAYRLPGAPHLTRGSILVPLLLVAPAVAAWGAWRLARGHRWWRGALIGAAVAVPASAIAVRMTISGVRYAHSIAQWYPANFAMAAMPTHAAFVRGVALALGAGAVCGVIGEGFGLALARVRT